MGQCLRALPALCQEAQIEVQALKEKTKSSQEGQRRDCTASQRQVPGGSYYVTSPLVRTAALTTDPGRLCSGVQCSQLVSVCHHAGLSAGMECSLPCLQCTAPC